MQMSPYKTGDIGIRLVDSTNVNFLVGVLLFYSRARRCHGGKLGEGYTESLYYFSIMHVNQQLSQNKKI